MTKKDLYVAVLEIAHSVVSDFVDEAKKRGFDDVEDWFSDWFKDKEPDIKTDVEDRIFSEM